MRLKIVYSGMMLAAIVVLVSCNAQDTALNTNNVRSTPPSPEASHADDARRITTAELETLIKEGKAYVVDVRMQDAYDMGHIPGSHLIPAGEILRHIDRLPRDKTIVTYCS